jgi:hypothetical protein
MNTVGAAADSSGAHMYIHLHRYIMLCYTYIVYIHYVRISVSRDSVVGIATRYGLDGPDIDSRWRRNFPHPSRPALTPAQTPIQWVPGPSPE